MMKIQSAAERIEHDQEESVLGFGRVIRYMSEKLGGFGGWGPRSIQ